MTKFFEKVTVSELTKFSKEQAEQTALHMKNPVIVPVYMAIDLNENGGIGQLSTPNLRDFFGKDIVRPDVSYTEQQYIIFTKFQDGIVSGSVVEQFLAKYEDFQDWFNKEGISEQALFDMKERYEKEHEQAQYTVKHYSDDLKKY